jgi:valyl-tRNA synthetase
MEKLLKIINQKLNNENFIKKAPKILIEKEKKKKREVEYKIKIIKNTN